MRYQKHLRFVHLFIALSVAMVTLVSGYPGAQAATLLKGSFSGSAYGSYANLTSGTNAAALGRSAYVTTPCIVNISYSRTNSVDAVSAGKILQAKTVSNTVSGSRNSSTAVSRGKSTVSGLSVLDGRIKATTVQAFSTTNANTTRISTSPSGSQYVGLTILGRVYTNVAANSRVNIPSFGYVKLNEQIHSGNGTSSAYLTVNMIHIYITTANSLKIPVGTQIYVAHATSGYSRTLPATIFGGSAYVANTKTTVARIRN